MFLFYVVSCMSSLISHGFQDKHCMFKILSSSVFMGLKVATLDWALGTVWLFLSEGLDTEDRTPLFQFLFVPFQFHPIWSDLPVKIIYVKVNFSRTGPNWSTQNQTKQLKVSPFWFQDGSCQIWFHWVLSSPNSDLVHVKLRQVWLLTMYPAECFGKKCSHHFLLGYS